MRYASRYLWTTVLVLAAAQQAFAGGITGEFNVLPAGFVDNKPVCDLQENTTEKIDLSSSQITMSLYIGDEYPGQGPFTTMFQAALGDVIVRPTPDLVKLGYTTVDRQITSYDASSQTVQFAEYLYDMTLTDEEGLKAGPYKSITLQPNGQGGVSYTKTYSDGEVYKCQLVPKQ